MSDEWYTRTGDELFYHSCGVWVECPLCNLNQLNISSLRTGLCHSCGDIFDVAVTVDVMHREGDSDE